VDWFAADHRTESWHSATEPGIRGALVEAVDEHAAIWLKRK